MRSRRKLATLTAAVMIGSVGPALTGVAGAVPAAAGGTIVTVMDATQALGLDPGSGLDGLATLWVGGGRVAFFGHRVSGGTIRFGGEITVRSGARTARLTDLTLDIGTGTVDATLDSQPLRLATMDTDNLRLRKNPGDKNLYLGIGFGEDSRAVLTSDGAAALNSALAIGTLAQGLPLLGGTISVGLAVDERVAAEVNTDAPALIENGVVVDIGLDERIDLSDDLGRG
ncbi:MULTISPECIES: hypothetical protein [Nocardia]|uniref:hypothetical protein n=1 Tax=Nocardia TaxID=1817 RepID=UPI0013009157|nr:MULTISPECIES: hypothetical protein [Nocardia]